LESPLQMAPQQPAKRFGQLIGRFAAAQPASTDRAGKNGSKLPVFRCYAAGKSAPVEVPRNVVEVGGAEARMQRP